MATEARIVLPYEARLVRGLLIERVEYGSQLRIHGGNFHDRAALAKPQIRVVVEVDRPRCPRPNAIALQAGLGEDQHLRALRYIQRPEHRSEVSEFLFVGEVQLASV